jgi:predicted dithiol-disulfide oxidoreductase (DUF899 family)
MFMTEVKTQIETLEAEIEAKKNELTELRRAMPKLRVPDLELKDSSGNLLTLRQMFGQYKDLIVFLLYAVGRRFERPGAAPAQPFCAVPRESRRTGGDASIRRKPRLEVPAG